MRPPRGPAARAAPPPALPPPGRSGVPEADGTREAGSGGAWLRTRGAGCRGLSAPEERSRGGREGWARGEPERVRAAACAAQSFVELAVAVTLPGCRGADPGNGGPGDCVCAWRATRFEHAFLVGVSSMQAHFSFQNHCLWITLILILKKRMSTAHPSPVSKPLPGSIPS